ILDEVQSGMGRSGKLFAHEWAGITPDVMAIAKGIGGGFPVGAFVASNEAAKGMVPGTHGSTFGRNPLAMAGGNAVLDAILEPGFLAHVEAMSLRFKQELAAIKDEFPAVVEEVRASGLLTGIKVKPPYGEVVNACTAQRLLTVGAGDNVVRLLPPLNVTEAEVSEATKRLAAALRSLSNRAAGSGRAPLKDVAMSMAARHFLDIDRIDAGTLRRIVDMGHAMKKAGKRVPAHLKPAGIADAVLMLIFEKPSTRTRVS